MHELVQFLYVALKVYVVYVAAVLLLFGGVSYFMFRQFKKF